MNRGEKATEYKNTEGLVILKPEVRSAQIKRKRKNATGPDEIVKEMLTVLDVLEIIKVTKMINEIYDSGIIPEDLKRSIFIVL